MLSYVLQNIVETKNVKLKTGYIDLRGWKEIRADLLYCLHKNINKSAFYPLYDYHAVFITYLYIFVNYLSK